MSEPSDTTYREKERGKEDEVYTSVIIKRNDESTRHPNDTLEIAIEEGFEQAKRTNVSLFLSSLAAGLILGFVAMLVALAYQLPIENIVLQKLAMAIVYPLGFIVCIMSGTQLFTEHTATAVYPFLDKRIKLKALVIIWAVVILGNLLGTLVSSLMLYKADFIIGASDGYKGIYHHLLEFKFTEVLYSGILAGWLMAQGGWLVMCTSPTTIKALCIYIVTFIIGIGGFHHSIAGSAEIFSGLLHVSNPEYFESIRFILAALIGNTIGGSVFVALLNYSHIKKT